MKNEKQLVNNHQARKDHCQCCSTQIVVLEQRIQQLEKHMEKQIEQNNLNFQLLQNIDKNTTDSRQDEQTLLDRQHESESETKSINDKLSSIQSALDFIKKSAKQPWFAATLLGATCFGFMMFFGGETVKAGLGGDEFFETITSPDTIKKAAASLLRTTTFDLLNHTDMLSRAFPMWFKQ